MTNQKSGILLKKTSPEIAKFRAIHGPGVYEVHAGTSNWVEQDGLKEGKYIIGVKAIAAHNVDKFATLFADSDETEIENLNGLTMTANVPVNHGKCNIPMKNQLVKIMVDYVDNKDKTAKVLAIVQIEVPKASKGASIFTSEEEAEDTGRISSTDAVNAFEANKEKVTA